MLAESFYRTSDMANKATTDKVSWLGHYSARIDRANNKYEAI